MVVFNLRAFSLFFFIIFFSTKSNQLLRVFHHQGIYQDKLVFYFKNDISVKCVSNKKISQNLSEQTFVCSEANIDLNEELKNKLNKINNFEHPFYNIKIIELSKNILGIQVKFRYNRKFIKKIEVMHFDAISSFKGITFNIEHNDIKELYNYPTCVIGSKKNKNKPNIVIDFGHGGDDTGAIASNGLKEKDVTLIIGLKLKSLLEKAGFNVFLTRDIDKNLALDERTSMANFLPEKAEIFVSIHANHSNNVTANGLETFIPSFSLLKKSNFEKNYEQLESQFKIVEQSNILLGSLIHDNLFKIAKNYNKDLIDRKLKKSISQVLLGTEMPSVLIELGFLSNKKEADLLKTSKYQNVLAKGIFKGICQYFENAHFIN